MRAPLIVQQQFFLVTPSHVLERSTSLDKYATSALSVADEPTSDATFQVPSPVNVAMPTIYESELQSQYTELADALAELASSEDEEWSISNDVKGAALFAALNLWEQRLPAPKVFTHGGDSVVFNWTNGIQNLYLTISANKGSALISTPQRIERRWHFRLSDLVGFANARTPLGLGAEEIRTINFSVA